MIPAAFGVAHAALTALDAHLAGHLNSLAAEDAAAAWRASIELCRATETIHDRCRGALTDEILRTSGREMP